MLDRRRIVAAVLVWLLVFGVFVAIAGADQFVTNLSEISPAEYVFILSIVVAYVLAMGSMLFVVTRSLGLGLSLSRSILLDTAVRLAHNLTPFGQVSGTAIGAGFIAKYSDNRYERCLAALSAKEVINFVPSTAIFVVCGSLLVGFEGTIPGAIRPLLVAFVLSVLFVAGVVVTISRFPDRTGATTARIVTGLNRTVGRISVVPTLAETEIHDRVDGFRGSLGGVAADRQAILLAATLGTCGFVAEGVLLWGALLAVGVDISLVLAVFVVPVSLLAGATPLPGGSGGIEGVQILLITVMTSSVLSPVITAVVLSRGLIYWTPNVVGAVTLLVFEGRSTLVEKST